MVPPDRPDNWPYDKPVEDRWVAAKVFGLVLLFLAAVAVVLVVYLVASKILEPRPYQDPTR